jgi:hypothetical protein
MGVAEHPAPDAPRPREQRGRLLGLARALGDASELVQHTGELVVVRPEHALVDRQRVAQRRRCLAVAAARIEDGRQRDVIRGGLEQRLRIRRAHDRNDARAR